MTQNDRPPAIRITPQKQPGISLPAALGFMALVLVGSTAAFLWYYDHGVEPESLDMELAKVALQVGVVSVLGAILSLLVVMHQQRIDADEQARERLADQLRIREDLLKSTQKRITTSYNDSKRARRLARALGLLPGDDRIKLTAYDSCMLEVIDAQLEFETIEDEVREDDRGAYPSAKAVADALQEMEQYLSELIKEYERERGKVAADQTDIPLASVNWLSDFLGKAAQSQFKPRYSEHLRAIRTAIGHDIWNLAAQGRS